MSTETGVRLEVFRDIKCPLEAKGTLGKDSPVSGTFRTRSQITKWHKHREKGPSLKNKRNNTSKFMTFNKITDQYSSKVSETCKTRNGHNLEETNKTEELNAM